MVVFISIIGGLLFSIFIYMGVFLSQVRKKKLELIEWFLLAVASFNGIGFGFVIWATYEGRNPVSRIGLLLTYDINIVINYLLLNIILTVSVFLGWCLVSIINNPLKSFNQEMPLEVVSYMWKKYNVIAWFTLFGALLSYVIYTLPYGGFINYLDYSKSIRAGVSSVRNSFSFLKPFGSLAFFSSFLFFGILLDRKIIKIKKKKTLTGFILAFSFSIYVLYSWEGRFALMTYLLTFGLAYILYNYSTIFQFLRKILVFVLSALAIVVGTDIILDGSSLKIGIVELFAKELSFPFISFISQYTHTEFSWFLDIIVAPLFILPERIWSGLFHIETASSFNTFLVAGARKGEAGVTGELPIDILTFGYMQASIIGIIVVGLIWGLTLFGIDQLIKGISIKGIRIAIYANIIINVPIRSVLYGDPQHIINRNFSLILGLVLIFFFFRKYRKQNFI